ncbi:hypothetical protein JK359_08410 [Streptomyces actinomycinicus]|uniref:Uncharacterized protein n=1 Tax=Streptomyces actinomycinicus TaxID=1695166 RepID=A0A937EH77_9ACTN|nr:hypothetical protein [Streptomyces actinomycinicus]MBL1082004.1 hypothetical protein [Streptomyces actinomycinicus]
MSELANDSEWNEADEEVSELGAVEAASNLSQPTELSSTEKNVVRDLSSHKIDIKETGEDYLSFSAHPNWDEGAAYGTAIPRQQSSLLLNQLQLGVNSCKKWAGITIPSRGYVEVLLRANSAFLPSSNSLLRSLMHAVPEEVDGDCKHKLEANAFLTVSAGVLNARDRIPSLHVSDSGICMEISAPSPACHVLANVGYQHRARFPLSVKVEFGSPSQQDELEAEAELLLNSFVYELEVRNGAKMRLVRWPTRTDRRHRLRRERPSRVVRFPRTKIDPDVSVLFGFAGSATGNPSLAFLSYYQVLENFFPVAIRRSALRQLELELSDQRFDASQDKYLMRILSVAENAASSSESTQLRVLLQEFVRGGVLQDFFTEHDWGKYFSKQGPIRGITDSINPENRNTPLAHQVADRVYRIRNRIVHSKDDPKYQNVPALLPQSDEAEALGPDIDLVRLLAFEVILSTQSTRRNG